MVPIPTRAILPTGWSSAPKPRSNRGVASLFSSAIRALHERRTGSPATPPGPSAGMPASRRAAGGRREQHWAKSAASTHRVTLQKSVRIRAASTAGKEIAMTTSGSATDGLSTHEHRAQLRRAVIASTIGTTIEWYDFFIYGTVTGLVFPKLYFPQSDPLVGTLQAFAIYAVGFVSRPVGAAIFGHYGDRIGRKSALIGTLLLTGLATFAVGFVPGYDQIGIWGAIILIVLRFIQGIGVGGEWAGAVLLPMEWAGTNAHRGFITSWTQFGAPAGLFLANLAVLAFSAVSGDQFLAWGWRVAFWCSIIIGAIGLYL